jgi:FtsH-binding integral membrane protein
MADLRNMNVRTAQARTYDASIDEGLRAYMIRVYNLMASGLALTALVALGTVTLATTTDPSAAVAQLANGKMLTGLGATLYGSPLRWVVMLAPLALVFFLRLPHRAHQRIADARPACLGFAGLIGLSMSSIFLVFTSASIVQTFFITATAFGALSLYGYTTKRDLTAMGSFLFMGLVGS